MQHGYWLGLKKIAVFVSAQDEEDTPSRVGERERWEEGVGREIFMHGGRTA